MIRVSAVCAVALGVGLTLTAWGHPQTERYIPIGDSSAQTFQGRIRSHATEPHELSVATVDGLKHVTVTDHTDIWIDRSRQRKSNLVGSYADCARGRHIEVKYRRVDEGYVAEWIKVRSD